MNKIITVLGGDARQSSLVERLCEKTVKIHAFGLPPWQTDPRVVFFDDWKEAVKGACAVILPLPASPDGRRVHMPLMAEAEAPLIEEVLSLAKEISVIGGKFSPGIKALAEEKGVELFDFYEDEDFQQKNALPTAEGAISILMREIPRTVCGLSVAVTGFGRVAKALVDLLIRMRANVTVAARGDAALSAAQAMGCRTVRLSGTEAVAELVKGQAAILNTVPHWLFTDEVFKTMRTRPLMIDLASAPGGIDGAAASVRGIRVIWALSLPGTYAPVTAGEIIADTVVKYLREELAI